MDNDEEMDIKEELEIKQDSRKEYLGKFQYKVHVKIGNLIVKYMGVLLISFLPPRFKGNSKPYYYYILL